MLLMITGLYPLGVPIYIITDQTHYEKSDWSRAFNQFTTACERDMINEGCPIHPTRVDSSLVFAIRQTGNRTLFHQIDTNCFPFCQFDMPEVDLRET